MTLSTAQPDRPRLIKRLKTFFPEADPQVVNALSAHTNELTRYLSQIHEVTPSETTEAIDAFFTFDSTASQGADAA